MTMNIMVKLSTSNYSIWKPMIEDVLYCKHLHGPIEGDSAMPSDMSNRDWKKLNRLTIECIRQFINVSVFHHLSQETKMRKLFGKN